MIKKTLSWLLRLLGPALLVLFLLNADLGRLWATLRGALLWPIILSLLLMPPFVIIKAWRWARLLREMGVAPLIHQPSYSLMNRWIEEDLLDALDETGMGCIAFSALAQGLLTDKYLGGIPADARINRPGGDSLKAEHLNEQNLKHVRGLSEIALLRGQSLAQMATAWVLRDPRVTSALIGASRPAQITELVGALSNLQFSAEELAAIDQHAVEGGINLWARPSTDQRP